jgi:hypothetical protein
VLRSCSSRIGPPVEKKRENALGMARLIAAISIIVLYVRDALGLYSWSWYRRPPRKNPTPWASSRLARIAPMIEARTSSWLPAFNATRAMISSGAFPNVALSRPPIASPVRCAICSVDCTISAAIGTIARAAEKKRTGSETPACSRATVMGMKAKSQKIDGLSFISASRDASGAVGDDQTGLEMFQPPPRAL